MSLLKKLGKPEDVQQVEVRRKTYYKGITEKALQEYSKSNEYNERSEYLNLLA